MLKTTLLFVATAFAEIIGCYLPYLWLRQNKSPWLLAPAALSLIAFAYLLTLHPTAAGRVYAAYGGVYVTVALLWLWLVDDVRPLWTDLCGVALCLLGMAIIMFGPHGSTYFRKFPSLDRLVNFQRTAQMAEEQCSPKSHCSF